MTSHAAAWSRQPVRAAARGLTIEGGVRGLVGHELVRGRPDHDRRRQWVPCNGFQRFIVPPAERRLPDDPRLGRQLPTPQDPRECRQPGRLGLRLASSAPLMVGSGFPLHRSTCSSGEERIAGDAAWMILADNEAGRCKALDQLRLLQQADFDGTFEAMRGLPVTIRLLDPPLQWSSPESRRPTRRCGARSGHSARASNPRCSTAWPPAGARLPGDLRDADQVTARAALAVEARPRRGTARRGIRLSASPRSSPAARADRARGPKRRRASRTRSGRWSSLHVRASAGEIAAHADFSFGTNDLGSRRRRRLRDDAEGVPPRAT